MRLIDADTIIDKSYWHGEMPSYDNPFPHGRDAVDVEDIENAPTIDAIKVVRCKDCVCISENKEKGYKFCVYAGWLIKDDDFCSKGARLEEVQE